MTNTNTWKVYMLAAISFLVGTSQFVIVGTLDQIAAALQVSVATAGQLITVFALAGAIGTPVVMIATAKLKLDRRKQLLLALSLFLLGIVSTLVLPGFFPLMVSRAVLGVASGVYVVTAYAVAAKLAASGRHGRAMSNISLGFSASLVFGVPLGRVVAAAYDWKAIFWALGLLTLLAILAVARTIPGMPGDAPVPLGRQLALLRRPRIATALGVTLFVFIGYSVVNTYIAPLLAFVMPISDSGISAILFALGIASLLGSKLGGYLSDRLGPSRTLLGSIAVQALALVIVPIAYSYGGAIVAVAMLVCWTVAAWTFGPSQNVNLVSLAPEASGIMLSLNSSFVQLGFAAGAGIGGVAAGAGSMLAVSWIGAAAVALAACIAVASSAAIRRLAGVQQ